MITNEEKLRNREKAIELSRTKSPDLNDKIQVVVDERTTLYFDKGKSEAYIKQRVEEYKKSLRTNGIILPKEKAVQTDEEEEIIKDVRTIDYDNTDE